MYNLKISGAKAMKKTDFNALLAHIENELQGFKRQYKLYCEVYLFKNTFKTKGIEIRFRTLNMIQAQKFDFIKDDHGQCIDEKVTHDSCYKLTSLQSVKILQFLESIV